MARGVNSVDCTPPPSVKTGSLPPVRKNIFYGLAADRQEYGFVKIGQYISSKYIYFLTNVDKQEIMGAGLGGTKWAKICTCANNELWAPGYGGGGTTWAKIRAHANNKI